MLQRQSPGELPYQHQKLVYRALPPNGRPQQVYIFGRPVSGAVDLLRQSGTADYSYQAILIGRYGHRLLSSCSRYPTFPSERALYPFTCQTLCAMYDDPPGWCHGSATRHRSACVTLPVYSISNPRPPQFLPLLTIPLTLELDAIPGCRPTMIVHHALDSPWAESSMDVLAVAVPIVVKHFLPIVCRVPASATQEWPIPST